VCVHVIYLYIYIHIHTYIHTNKHTYIYIYIYITHIQIIDVYDYMYHQVILCVTGIFFKNIVVKLSIFNGIVVDVLGNKT